MSAMIFAHASGLDQYDRSADGNDSSTYSDASPPCCPMPTRMRLNSDVPRASITLRTPLWPFADPPNLMDVEKGLCESESWMTITRCSGAGRAYALYARPTARPEMFMSGSVQAVSARSQREVAGQTWFDENEFHGGLAAVYRRCLALLVLGCARLQCGLGVCDPARRRAVVSHAGAEMVCERVHDLVTDTGQCETQQDEIGASLPMSRARVRRVAESYDEDFIRSGFWRECPYSAWHSPRNVQPGSCGEHRGECAFL